MLIVCCVNTQFLSADCAFDLQLCFSSRDFTCRLIMTAFEETKLIAHSVLGRKLICSPPLCGLLWEKRSSRESIAILALPCSNTITWAVKGNHRPMNWINRNFVCFRSKKKWEKTSPKRFTFAFYQFITFRLSELYFFFSLPTNPTTMTKPFPFSLRSCFVKKKTLLARLHHVWIMDSALFLFSVKPRWRSAFFEDVQFSRFPQWNLYANSTQF